MNRFQGKTALVTGGGSGIGLATAKAYALEGARVAITGRDLPALKSAQSQLSSRSLYVENDSADPDGPAKLVNSLCTQGVTLDAVFINAGITQFCAFADVTAAFWDQTFNINLKGAYFQLKALLPLMNAGSAIVLNGSINAHVGMPGTSVYAASKAALISLAITLSSELVPRGIRVNVISPGPIDTPLYDKLGLKPADRQTTKAQIENQIPIGRFGTPEEVAATVLHLTSPESAFIVGTEIVIDGGMSQL